MPITWRNVGAGNNAAAVGFMRQASQSLNQGLDSFKDILDDQQSVVDENFQTQKTNNTQTYLDALAGYSTPEELEAARNSGALDELRASLGPNINKEKVRGAADSRLTELVTQDNAAYTREQNLLDRQASPLEQQYLGLVNAGKFDEARAFLDSNAQTFTDAGDLGRLTGTLQSAEQNAGDRAYTLTKRDWEIRDRARQEQAIADENQLNQTINEGLMELRSAQQGSTDTFLKLAAESGLPVVNGQVDYSNATNQDLALFQRRLNESNLGKAPNYTQSAKDIEARLIEQNPDISAAKLNEAYETVVAGQARINGIAPQDQEAMNRKLDSTRRGLKMNQNAFFKEQDFNPGEAANTIIDKAMANNEEIKEEFGNGDVKQEVIGLVQSALQNGVQLNGETYPVTPSMVEGIVQKFHADWLENDDTFTEEMTKFVESDAYKAQLDNWLKYQDAESELLTAAQARAGGGNGLNAYLTELRSAIDRGGKTLPPATAGNSPAGGNRRDVSAAEAARLMDMLRQAQ